MLEKTNLNYYRIDFDLLKAMFSVPILFTRLSPPTVSLADENLALRVYSIDL